MKLNLNSIINTLKDVKGYLFPVNKLYNKFKKINTLEELQAFIQERSAHVTQTTLYGYIKTRIGTRYAMMFEDKVFSQSINIAKWNIYSVALQDLTFFTFSYLKVNFNYQDINQGKEIFNKILDDETSNKMPLDIIEEAKKLSIKNYKI